MQQDPLEVAFFQLAMVCPKSMTGNYGFRKARKRTCYIWVSHINQGLYESLQTKISVKDRLVLPDIYAKDSDSAMDD